MAFDAHVLTVFISSPGDTAAEVEAVTNSLHGWNSARAESAQTILLPRFWKRDAVPTLTGKGGQSVINAQLLDDADIVIALFDSRLGQATDSAVSGTAEEIEQAADSGKPVHVWFSNEPINRKNIDLEELARLEKFRKELEGRGLLGIYADLNDLAYKVRDAIERDISGMGLGAPSVVRKGERAMPRVTVEHTREQTGIDSKGAPKFTTRSKLVLANKSQTVTAEGLTVDVGSDLRGALLRDNKDPVDLPPLSDLKWPLALDMGSPDQVTVELNWVENGQPRSLKQPLSVF